MGALRRGRHRRRGVRLGGIRCPRSRPLLRDPRTELRHRVRQHPERRESYPRGLARPRERLGRGPAAGACGRGPRCCRVTYDAIVVGLGAHGSAAAAELARRGLRVLGLDRFGPGHGRGSSGGLAPLTRVAHYEHPWLGPLAVASWEAWRALEAETGLAILTETGGLYAGPAGDAVVAGASAGGDVNGLDLETIDADEIRRRWPILSPAEDAVGI